MGWLLPVVGGGYVQSVVAQKPKRWVAGDTLWLEIDSIPALPSDGLLLPDSLRLIYPYPHPYPVVSVNAAYPDSLLRGGFSAKIPFEYHPSRWSVYRRSVTLWGITLSAGQINPYWPYPAGANQEATVLSFPLQPPR